MKKLKVCFNLLKIAIAESKTALIIIMLFTVSAILMILGFGCTDNRVQSLLIGLGTGAFTSAIVSIVFNVISKEKYQKNQLETQKRIRKTLMDDFRVFFYNVVFLIDYTPEKDKIFELDVYIKNQHRWFHEYYKQMVAENIEEAETKKRVDQIEEFMSYTLSSFQQCFEYNSMWKDGNYTDWQKRELSQLYSDYKSTQICLQNKRYQRAFLEFSSFLEILKRLVEKFDELSNFRLLKFSYDSEGELTVQTEAFEEKEPFFKFAREFNEIRESNYKKYYAKDNTGGAQ